jgi:tetratricopeptide (TPR) repeat protein
MSIKPLSVDQALIKAKSLAEEGEFDQAMRVYQAVLGKFPGNQRATEGLKSLKRPTPNREQKVLNPGPTQEQIDGLIALINRSRFLEALEQAAALAERHPTAAVIHNILGRVNAGLGRSDQAVASLTKALQIKPDFAEAHNNLGNALRALGKHAEAIASFTKALQTKPDDAEVHMGRMCPGH